MTQRRKKNSAPGGVYTVAEVAQLWHTSPRMVQLWCAAGRLRAVKLPPEQMGMSPRRHAVAWGIPCEAVDGGAPPADLRHATPHVRGDDGKFVSPNTEATRHERQTGEAAPPAGGNGADLPAAETAVAADESAAETVVRRWRRG